MELCAVGSVLSTYEVLHKGLDESQLAYVIYRILVGLNYLHGIHRIHRDIKSGNILITSDGGVKIGLRLVVVENGFFFNR
jgi:serine/threonine protein kinase